MAIPIQPTGCQPETLNSCNETWPSNNTYPKPGKKVVTQGRPFSSLHQGKSFGRNFVEGKCYDFSKTNSGIEDLKDYKLKLL